MLFTERVAAKTYTEVMRALAVGCQEHGPLMSHSFTRTSFLAEYSSAKVL